MNNQEIIKDKCSIGENFIIIPHKRNNVLGIVEVPKRGFPRLTVLQLETAFGIPAVITYMVRGDQLKNPKARCGEKEANAFKEKILGKERKVLNLTLKY